MVFGPASLGAGFKSADSQMGAPDPQPPESAGFTRAARDWHALSSWLANENFPADYSLSNTIFSVSNLCPPPFGLLCLGVLAEQDWAVESVAGRGGVAEGRWVALAPASWSSLKSSQPLHLQGCRLSGKPLEVETLHPHPPPRPRPCL